MQKANESPIISCAYASGVDSPQNSTVSTELGSWRMLSMSAYGSTEFTPAEKVELLVNILQSLIPDLPQYLFNCLVSDVQREPRWSDTALPNKRTLHSCQIAFEEMRRSYGAQSGSIRSYPPPYVNIAPNLPANRSVSVQDTRFNAQRQTQNIQPKPVIRSTESPHPVVTNGESPPITRGQLLDPTPGTSGSRKRGRPSKEEVAERTARYAAEGKVYQPKKRPTKKLRPSVGPEFSELKDEEPSTPLLQTSVATVMEPSERSSSGRRRPKRPEQEGSPTAATGASTELRENLPELEQEQEQESILSVVESPSDRLFPGHRDRGSVGSSLSRRTQQESDTAEQGHTESEYLT